MTKYECFATATSQSGLVENGEFGDTPATARLFSISLAMGEKWTVTCGLREAATKIPMMSDSCGFEPKEEEQVFSHVFTLVPCKEGSGSVALEMTVPATIIGATVECSDPRWEAASPEVSVVGTTLGINVASIQSGYYDVCIRLYNSDGVLSCGFWEEINVFDGAKTNYWLSSGGTVGVTVSGGALAVGETALSAFSRTLFYVGDTGISGAKGKSDSNDGNPYSPFETLNKAVAVIKSMGAAGKDYKIYVSGTVEGCADLSSALDGKARSITIEGANGLYTSGPNAGQPKDTLDADGIGSALCVQTTVPVSIRDLRITGADGVSGLSIQDDGADVTLLGGTLITGNQADKGGGVYISAGSLAIKGAVISGNIATAEGGGIYNDGGSVTFYFGSIESNSALGYGGGVSNNSGSFEMKDGACIKENSANDGGDGTYSDGGGVFVYGGSFTMSGGTISGNSTNGRGGAVYVFGGAFSVGGSANIPCGTGNDVYLDSDQSIAIASALNSNFAALITLPDDDYKMGTQVLSGTEELLDSECLKFNVFQPESASQFLFVGSQGKLRTLISFPNGTKDGTEINEDDSLSYDVYKYSYINYDTLSMSVVNPYETLGYTMQVKVDGATPDDLTKLADGFHTVYAKIEKAGKPTIEDTVRVCVKIKTVRLTLYKGEINHGYDKYKGRVAINGGEVRSWSSWTGWGDPTFNTYNWSFTVDAKDYKFLCQTTDSYGRDGSSGSDPLRDAYRQYTLAEIRNNDGKGKAYIGIYSGTYPDPSGHSNTYLTLQLWFSLTD